MNPGSYDIDQAYQEAQALARTHYENFPVASFLISKELRKHIAAVYWFARTADDIVDEGEYTAEERTQQLDDFLQRFNETLTGIYRAPVDAALHDTIQRRELDPRHFTDLLDAFRQDITTTRYREFEEILHYCERSANPVGRIVLELHGKRNEEAAKASDDICTALQLTNFYQDVSRDILKGRIYIPLTELKRFGVEESEFAEKKINDNFRALIEFQVNRAAGYFDRGERLLGYLEGRLKYEITWTVLGGRTALSKIAAENFDVLNHRPALSKLDFFKLLGKALVYG